MFGGFLGSLFDKPSNISQGLANLSKGWDPLGHAIFNQDVHNIKTTAGDPLLSGIATGVAGYFGGPWGAGLAQTALAKERGNSWQEALTQGAVTGAMSYGLGRAASGGESAGTSGYSGDTTAAGYDPEFGSMTSSSSSAPAAGSQQATWSQPTTSSVDTGSSAMSSPSGAGAAGDMPMDYGMGSADMSQASFPQGGGMGMDQGWTLRGMLGGANDYLTDTTGMGLRGWTTGLYDMYSKYQGQELLRQQAEEADRRRQALEDSIINMYGETSPEYQAMKQQLERQDAASGRRSQYGQRAVDLAARIADIRAQQRARLAPQINALGAQAAGYRQGSQALGGGMFNTLGSNWALSNMR